MGRVAAVASFVNKCLLTPLGGSEADVRLSTTSRHSLADKQTIEAVRRNAPNCGHRFDPPFCADTATRRSDMSYQTDRRSRTRAIAVYMAFLCVGAVLGLLVRLGVITDHILW